MNIDNVKTIKNIIVTIKNIKHPLELFFIRASVTVYVVSKLFRPGNPDLFTSQNYNDTSVLIIVSL